MRELKFRIWYERIALALGTAMFACWNALATFMSGLWWALVHFFYIPSNELPSKRLPPSWQSGTIPEDSPTVQAFRMMAEAASASKITLDAQHRPIVDQMYTAPPLAGMAGASALSVAPQTSSGYTPLLDDETAYP